MFFLGRNLGEIDTAQRISTARRPVCAKILTRNLHCLIAVARSLRGWCSPLTTLHLTFPSRSAGSVSSDVSLTKSALLGGN